MPLSKEQIDNWRAIFEQELINSSILADLARKPPSNVTMPNGDYVNYHTEDQWLGFKLAMKSIAIEFPNKIIPDPESNQDADFRILTRGKNDGIDICRKFIEAQGFKVKS